MGKNYLFIMSIFIILLTGMVFALEVCEYEQDPNSACVIVTPAGMGCNTYDLIAPDNSTNISGGVMGVVNANFGIYSVNFNQSDVGGWIVKLCDNSSGQINIKTVDQTAISEQTIDLDLMINTSRDAENETRNQIVELQDAYNDSIPGMLEQQAEIDNETRTWLGGLIQDVNSTLSFNVLPLLLDNVFGLEAIANLINALNDITAADVWNFGEKNLTSLDVGDQIIATQENMTDLNSSISGIANETSIALAVLENTDLANKTVVYSYAWDLANVTTTYDDLGYEMVETFIYNDTSNKWYLNSTESRRTI